MFFRCWSKHKKFIVNHTIAGTHASVFIKLNTLTYRNVFICFSLRLSMAIGMILIIITALIILIWVIMEFRRLRHKIFAIFLIILILFVYFSFTYAIKEKGFDLKTMPGIIGASKLYYSWMVSIFHNAITITSNAIKMNWGVTNSTAG